jgi:long-subunit fatty acid transport protein
MEQSLARFRATLAKDFRLRKAGEAGFLTHVSVGAGLDLGYEHWEFRQPTGDTSDTAAGLGFGAGLLVGVYDDTESFRVNLGFAWQSKIEYNFSIDPTILPAFNMPEQFNIGATFYLLEGMPLRATVDLQFIGWKDTAEDPIFTGQPSFEDAVNVSFGLEYRIKINDRVSLYPRGGYRRFDAPWDDKDDLPSTGRYKLVLDTKDDVFNIFTYGAGVTWTSDAGKSRSVDLAGDAGGDAINVALGFTYEF